MLKFIVLGDQETFSCIEGAILLTVDEATLSEEAREDMEDGNIESAIEEVTAGNAKGQVVSLAKAFEDHR